MFKAIFRIFYVLVISANVTAFAETAVLSKRFVPVAQTASLTGTWALWYNPAGLAFMGGNEGAINYLYEWSTQGNRHHGGAQLAFNWSKMLTIAGGLSSQAASNERAKENLGTDLNGIFGGAIKLSDYAGFGISFLKSHNFRSESSTNTLVTFGLQIRPFSFLSLGGHYEEVDGAYFAAPNLVAGLSLRPYKEYVTIGLDNRFVPLGQRFDDGFRYHPIMSLKTQYQGYGAGVSAEIPGVSSGFTKPIFSMLLDFNFSHLGLSVAGALNAHHRNYAMGGHVRTSSEEWPSIAHSKGLWVELTIDHEGRLEQKPKNLVARLFSTPDDALSVLALLKRIEHDNAIAHVVINLNGFSFGDARTQEWRNAIVSLRKANKEVIVYLDRPSERDYYVASAANRIHMNHYESLSLGDFQTTLVYYAELLDKLGVKADSVAAGSYKTAPHQWTHARPEKEDIEVANNILTNFYEQLLSEVGKARNVDHAKLKALFDKGQITAVEAKEAGLVDELVPPRALPPDVDPERPFFADYEHRVIKQERWHPAKKIVVLPVIDTIADKRTMPGLLSWLIPQTSAKDIIEEINDAVQDPSVTGIILRIDSPGGDASAGQRIAQALQEAQRTKPVVTSMSDVAASAGYMIAASTEHIVAMPNTITGSIGVFSLMFSGEDLAKKIGVFSKELSPVKNPGPTLYRRMTDSERTEAQRITDWYYQNFIEIVSIGLGIEKEDVENVANGRVWLGHEAFERKLVHELGGFSEAVDALKRIAEIPADEELTVEIRSPGQRQQFSLTANLTALFHSKSSDDKDTIKAIASPYLQAIEAYRINNTPQARLPFDVTKRQRFD